MRFAGSTPCYHRARPGHGAGCDFSYVVDGADVSAVIDELRTYRLVPGGLADYLRHAGGVAMPFRGDEYGKLLGFWYTEVGAVNCAFNLWRHKDLNTRQSLRQGLENKDEWRARYLAKVQPLMQSTEVRLMTPVVEMAAPATPGNLYELRIFQARIGKANQLASRLASDLPAHVAGSTVGIWMPIAGTLYEVIHLCAYRDLHERLAVTLQHAEWREFLSRNGALIDRIASNLLLSAEFSPMQ